MAIAAH